jgi:hypothetical protein
MDAGAVAMVTINDGVRRVGCNGKIVVGVSIAGEALGLGGGRMVGGATALSTAVAISVESQALAPVMAGDQATKTGREVNTNGDGAASGNGSGPAGMANSTTKIVARGVGRVGTA